VGCLLRQPTLLEAQVEGGRGVEEELTPDQMLPGPAQRLYDVLYERLCEGQDASLATLMSVLAQMGLEDELAGELTRIDEEVEAQSGGDDQRVRDIFLLSARAVLDVREEYVYRRQVLGRVETAQEQQLKADLAEQGRQLLRIRPSSLKIKRPGPA
jgi:hypothetical protein